MSNSASEDAAESGESGGKPVHKIIRLGLVPN
jgi:hypothetical protein